MLVICVQIIVGQVFGVDYFSNVTHVGGGFTIGVYVDGTVFIELVYLLPKLQFFFILSWSLSSLQLLTLPQYCKQLKQSSVNFLLGFPPELLLLAMF